ncbi:MAG: putative MFS family arabinose efflux permease [Hyphomicrobiaceae bacterium]
MLFSSIGEELVLTDTQLGVIGGLAFSMIYAIAAFVFGHYADRKIRRNLIAFGLIVWSLATAASGLATDFNTLFVARFFTGVGEASLYPCAMSLLAEHYPAESRGRALGIFGAAAAVGGGLGQGLGGYLASVMGWREVFFLYGGVGLAMVPLILSVVEKPRSQAGRTDSSFDAIRDVVRDTRLLLVWAAGTVMIAAGIGFSAWLPTFIERYHGFDSSGAGLVSGGGILLGGVFGSLLGGALADRRHRVRAGGELDVSAIGAFLAVPLMLMVLTVNAVPVLVVVGLITPVAIFVFFPSLQLAMMEIVPAHRFGIAYAVQVLFLGGIGTATGPFIIGSASDAFGDLRYALMVSAAMAGVAGVLALAAGRHLRTRAAQDPAQLVASEGADA